MTPIIDTKLIYLIGLIDRVSQLMDVGSVLLGVVLMICGILFLISYSEDFYDLDEGKEMRKRIRLPIRALAIALAVCTFLSLLLPTKENMIAMLIAKYATAENIDAVIDAIKSAAQEIANMS